MSKTMAVAVLLSTLSCGAAWAGVQYSKHDLSVTGTGVHSTTETRICSFCHRPHGGTGEPLWGREFPPLDTFVLCSGESLSDSANTAMLADTNETALCLSCHTATLASLGPNMVDPNGTWESSRLSWLGGTCLANHPVSFDYAWAQSEKPTKLRPIEEAKAALGSTSFYGSAATTMECGTCHTVHDNAIPPFLRKSNAASGLCLACHVPF